MKRTVFLISDRTGITVETLVHTLLTQFDQDPMQAVRAIRQQAATLKGLAVRTADAKLANGRTLAFFQQHLA